MHLLTNLPLHLPLIATLIREWGASDVAMRSTLRLLIEAWATAYYSLLVHRSLGRGRVPLLVMYLLLVLLLLWHGKEVFVSRLASFHRHGHHLLSGRYLHLLLLLLLLLLMCIVKVVLLDCYRSILFVLWLDAGFTSWCWLLLLLINFAHFDEPSVPLWLNNLVYFRCLSLLYKMIILF